MSQHNLQLLTIDQLCERYQINRSTWWRWSKTPGFPAGIGLRKTKRWDVSVIDAFLTRPSEAPASATK